MKRIYNILILAIALLPGCGKHHATPDESDTKIPIDFSAISNTTEVKSTTPLSSIHKDFGVWGIARNSSQPYDYILWEQDRMTQVVESSNGYAPVEAAFWLSGYTYNFIAIAPWEAVENGVTSINQGNASGSESISFSYNLADKYRLTTPIYDFDLMAAVAQSTVDKAATHKSQQDLTFWHLFAQICINVEFVGATGSVDEMRLYNVDSKADYTISFDNNDALSVNSQVSDDASQEKITFSDPADGSNILHIVPQDISDIKLFLDFTIEETQTSNFEINLSNAHNAPNYGYNQKYNWNIKISPKEISFDVTLSPWVSGGADDEFELEYPN